MGSGDFIAELIERGQSNLHDVLAEDELVGPAQRAQAEPVVPRARRASRESLGPPDLQTFDHRSIPGSPTDPPSHDDPLATTLGENHSPMDHGDKVIGP